MDQVLPVSVKGVLIENGAVVLLENERAEWELPGGRLEKGETPEECVVREFREELEAVIHVEVILDAWVYEVLPERFVFIVTYGVVRRRAERLRCSAEHRRMKWLPLERLSEARMPGGYRRSIGVWASRLARVDD